MVSLQTTLSTKERSFCCSSPSSTTTTLIDASKKRKRKDQFKSLEEESPSKELKLFFCTSNNDNSCNNNNDNNVNDELRRRSNSYVELQLEDAPLPRDWQRCLDIESGQITFYNTRTKSRTSRDPRRSTPPLNLDLNLSFELVTPTKEGKEEKEDDVEVNKEDKKEEDDDEEEKIEDIYLPLWTSSSRVDKRAMVATVCMHCHMLVMMCKTSPLCPNCKFLHPHTPTDAKQFLSYGK